MRIIIIPFPVTIFLHRNEEQAQGRKEPTTKKKLMPPKDFVIPRRGFRDVVRKVFTDLGHTDFSIQGGALDLLQVIQSSVYVFYSLRFPI